MVFLTIEKLLGFSVRALMDLFVCQSVCRILKFLEKVISRTRKPMKYMTEYIYQIQIVFKIWALFWVKQDSFQKIGPL